MSDYDLSSASVRERINKARGMDDVSEYDKSVYIRTGKLPPPPPDHTKDFAYIDVITPYYSKTMGGQVELIATMTMAVSAVGMHWLLNVDYAIGLPIAFGLGYIAMRKAAATRL